MPPAPGMVPAAPPQPFPTYSEPPAAPVAEVADVEAAEIAAAEADEISEGAPVFESEPAADSVVAVEPVVEPVAVEPVVEPVVVGPVVVEEPVVEAPAVEAEPFNAAPAEAEFVEPVVEAAAEEPAPVDTEPLSEPAAPPPVEAAPSLPGPSLPSVPAWMAPPTPPAPEPVADPVVVEEVATPASADEADEQPQDTAPGLAPAPGLLLPPPPPAHSFPPAPTPPAPELTTTEGAANDEVTQVAPTWGGTPTNEPAVAASSDIFRPYPGAAAAAATDAQAVTEEERRLAAERAARRDARAAALTATAVAPATPAASPAPAPVVAVPTREVRRTTDGFWASLGLFLVRLVMAAIFGIHGVQMLVQTAATQALFGGTILPMPATLGLVTAVASVLIAISMLLGLATRYSAIGAALIGVGSLALVYWGSWGVFAPGQFGFLGEGVLLVTAVGLLLTFIGGGSWSLDHSLRAARHRDKATRAIGQA